MKSESINLNEFEPVAKVKFWFGQYEDIFKKDLKIIHEGTKTVIYRKISKFDTCINKKFDCIFNDCEICNQYNRIKGAK
ncbi:MAG: hypothetical protein D4S01_09075 [Dehalococcoidia bacterium]|nr:MAG: hypothetical protein D4S01_09075 [Dehalococcoidia bacterium]